MPRPPLPAPRASFALAALVLSATAVEARAQGVPDPRTGIDYPQAQSAAVEDATALMVNPAGLAMMEGSELNLGAFLRAGDNVGATDVDGTVALVPGDGFGLALGGGLTVPLNDVPRLRTSAGLAVGAGRAVSLGVGLHTYTPLAGGGRPDFLVDVGTQLRPSRWLALGAELEGLGNQDIVPTSARVGVSIRPFTELLTVGADARVVPGSRNIASSAWASDLTVVPAAVVRLDLGGLAFSVGANLKNVGAHTASPTELEVLGTIELNGEHIGLAASGGAGGILAAGQQGLAGVRLRASGAQYPGLFPSSGRWLTMTLTGEGVPVDKDHGILNQLFGERPQAIAVLNGLRHVAEDPSVEGVVLRVKGMSLGWGRLAEIRAVLEKMRASGKKVVVHLDGGDDADVYLASVADKIYLTPSGGLELNGLRADLTYFGDTLDKVGVEAEAVTAGRYKSAPRTFTSDEPSPEELQVEDALLDGVFGALTEMVAKGRGLSVDDVKAVIDLGGLTAQQAVDKKIVDGLAYEDELQDKVKDLAGHAVNFEEDFLDPTTHEVRWDDPPRIALIPVVGDITMGDGRGGLFGGGGAGSSTIIDSVNDAANDDNVKAIVLRIDSPGGDALASDLIWHAVMKAREKKPVIASMGDVAASGGYYVASAAQEIFAEPNTITGSIGVFGLMFNVERLADDWGVRNVQLQRGKLPGPSLLHGLNEDERAALQGSVDATYQHFLEAVVTGRGKVSGLDKETLEPIAQGHVWTGAEAKERKLVDTIGGIGDALQEARKRAALGPDEEVGLDVLTGRESSLLKLAGLAEVAAGGARAASLERAVRLLLGDPDALALAVESEGRPLAVAPMRVRVR